MNKKALIFMGAFSLGGGESVSKDVSILFKAVDRVSEAIKGMRGGVKSLERDVQSYGKTSDRIFKERSEVRLSTEKAKDSLKKLSKAVLPPHEMYCKT